MMAEGNILILTQWSFKDALVQTYTLPYLFLIRESVLLSNKIFLITSEQVSMALQPGEEATINKDWSAKNMAVIPLPYYQFGLKKLFSFPGQFLKLRKLVRKENIRTIHAFGTPAGGIGYLLSKLTGANLIVDSFEPHAEAMVENGTWKKSGPAFTLLNWLEKQETRKAVHLIGTTSGMKQYAKDRFGVEIKSFFTKPACVDLDKFYPGEKDPALVKALNLEEKIVCVYAGKLGGIYLKEEVFDFIRACYDHWGERFRFLLLTNADDEEVNRELIRSGIPPGIVIKKFVFHNEIRHWLSLGDFAINPVKPVPTKKYCTSIKDGEYWAMGLPVVISPGISDDSYIIEKEKIGIVTDFYNEDARRSTVKQMDQLLNNGQHHRERIHAVAAKYRSFDIARKVYEEIYC